VSITKGGAIDYGDESVSASATPGKPQQKSTAEHILTEAKEKLSDAGSTVSGAHRTRSDHHAGTANFACVSLPMIQSDQVTGWPADMPVP
jgi:hypothetical protein